MANHNRKTQTPQTNIQTLQTRLGHVEIPRQKVLDGNVGRIKLTEDPLQVLHAPSASTPTSTHGRCHTCNDAGSASETFMKTARASRTANFSPRSIFPNMKSMSRTWRLSRPSCAAILMSCDGQQRRHRQWDCLPGGTLASRASDGS